MPWLPNGKFERVNPDYAATAAGVLWGQDLASTPSIKIVASRHDYHDQDLGDGIQATLNLDGLNAMRANLNLDGWKVVNAAAGVSSGDSAIYGQIAGSINFDNTSDILYLYDRDGNLIDSTTIVATGSGVGTVTSVGVDATLAATPNPITSSGTIGLLFLTPGQTYSGGIETISIDDYGRVTQVTTQATSGGQPDQTLSKSQYSTTAVTILLTHTNSASDVVTLSPASASVAGVMTSQMYNDLQVEKSLSANAVYLTGDQVINGNKEFLEQVFMDAGLTVDYGLRILNMPTTQPSLDGVLWNDGSYVRISP